MWSAAATSFPRPHLRPSAAVESVWAMGTAPAHTTSISTTIQSSHSAPPTRGLFCAQLLTCVLHSLAEATIPRHLPAHFVHAMNHGRMIPAAKRLPDLDQLHFQ